MLDQHHAWDEQMALLQAEISCSLGFLKYAKRFRPSKTINIIYIGMAEGLSHTFDIDALCLEIEHSKKTILQKLPNHAARILTNTSYATSPSPFLFKLSWLLLMKF